MIRILIADDHTVVRQGLKMILSEQSDMRIIGEAQNASELFDLVRRLKSDVLILDLSMPGMGGLDILRDLRASHPALRILVLSMLPEEQYARRVLKAGAWGYVSKGSPPADVIHAIRKIHGGGRYVSSPLAEQLAADLNQDSARPAHERLSDRELAVLLRIAAGETITHIAGELSVSTKTVTTYRSRILHKMSLKTNADIVRYVLDYHLVG